jgi:hypothetical protein
MYVKPRLTALAESPRYLISRGMVRRTVAFRRASIHSVVRSPKLRESLHAFMPMVTSGTRTYSLTPLLGYSVLSSARLVIFELAQIRHAIRAERELSQGSSYSLLWATPGNRKRMR